MILRYIFPTNVEKGGLNRKHFRLEIPYKVYLERLVRYFLISCLDYVLYLWDMMLLCLLELLIALIVSA